MITRIVRMRFRRKKIPQFLSIFRENCEAIRSFEGCLYLELLQDEHDPRTYLTLSVWQTENALDTYRKSGLFTTTWKQTRKLFRKNAEAYSLTSYIKL